MPKGFPIGGFEIAEKNSNKQTDKHFRIYISRDAQLRAEADCLWRLSSIDVRT